MRERRGEPRDLFSLFDEIIFRLDRILEKLSSLEEKLSLENIDSGEVKIALEIASVLSIPLIRALEYAKRAWSILSGIASLDPISQSIIVILSQCRGMKVIEIYRGVKVLRGRAFRRIVRNRIKILETMGIIKRVGGEKRPRYILRACIEGGENI
jgi:hypothetical protein